MPSPAAPAMLGKAIFRASRRARGASGRRVGRRIRPRGARRRVWSFPALIAMRMRTSTLLRTRRLTGPGGARVWSSPDTAATPSARPRVSRRPAGVTRLAVLTVRLAAVRARRVVIAARFSAITARRRPARRGRTSSGTATRAAPAPMSLSMPSAAAAVFAAGAVLATCTAYGLEHRGPRPGGTVVVLAETDRLRARLVGLFFFVVVGDVPRGETRVRFAVLRSRP